MEDAKIVELYINRDEHAISESSKKYGPYCTSIAGNILDIREDVEECVSDTWLHAWNAIPPARPNRLSVFLGRITRNLSIDRFRKEHAEKYGGGQTAICLDELSEVVGGDSRIEEEMIQKETLEIFLRRLPKQDKDMFLLRYWYMMPVEIIAGRFSLSEGAVKMRLLRIRKNLREYLENEA
ncbi:MAG: sigma-70 family RNA polymerase sigma factor [Clostridiales bacterium]|nr:sigma-70 family RNA polymerase sigma factor [Clostridiales bacterium]